MECSYQLVLVDSDICHHGIKGQKWGVRRYQNKDGSLTSAGRKRYGTFVEVHDALNTAKRRESEIAVSIARKKNLSASYRKARNVSVIAPSVAAGVGAGLASTTGLPGLAIAMSSVLVKTFAEIGGSLGSKTIREVEQNKKALSMAKRKVAALGVTAKLVDYGIIKDKAAKRIISIYGSDVDFETSKEVQKEMDKAIQTMLAEEMIKKQRA